MITVKTSTCAPTWNWIRQTPNNDGIWNNHKFIFDQPLKKCDYWIIFDDLIKAETTICNPKNIFLIMSEPPSVKYYHNKFLQQFATVITCHKKIKHPNVVFSHPQLPWRVGYQPPQKFFTQSYSDLIKIQKHKKEKLISVVCSTKTFTHGHAIRFNFVKKLHQYFGNNIDIFGDGLKPIANKFDVIAPYKYHIAIENSSFEHYWTEKISDTFLGLSYPFYYGCPNISNYFPQNSFTTINIFKPQEAFAIIKKTIHNHQYEKSINSLYQAKKLILNKYNFFPSMIKYCDNQNSSHLRKKITLNPQECFLQKDFVIKKIFRKVKYFITKKLLFNEKIKIIN